MFGLSIGRAQAVGHLECLWHWTAKYARGGGIGRWNDGAIASAAEWEGDPATFVRVLTDCGWLDKRDDCRLYVHDWHDHADESVHRELARARERFANGSAPRLGGLDKDEKESAKAFYAKPKRCAKNGATSGPRRGHPLPPAVAVPSPALPSPAEPAPVSAREGTGAVSLGVPEAERPAYADAVWSEFLRVSASKPTRVMAPGEWVVLKGWMDSGVPLHTVLRAFADTRGKGSSLGYYGPSVKAAIELWRKAVA